MRARLNSQKTKLKTLKKRFYMTKKSKRNFRAQQLKTEIRVSCEQPTPRMGLKSKNLDSRTSYEEQLPR